VGKTANYQTHIFPSLACEKQACANERKSDVSIRSQMLYPVELRPEKEQLICEKRGQRSNNPTGNEKFPAAFEVRNELLTQGYGVDRAKSSTLRSIPPASLHHTLQAGIDRGGVLRPHVGKQ